MGISKISGGIGKIELSINEIRAKARRACLWAAKFRVQSYNLRNITIYPKKNILSNATGVL
jgi:hypothetical protein